MSTSPVTASAAPSWLHCSPARTLWLRRDAKGGNERVDKVYVAGSMTAAEHECRLGRAAAGPGVVEYLGVAADDESGRPTVSMRHERGVNLECHVARHGALPAARALEVVAAAARTLARLHDLRSNELPNGMCHGDVKPQNLLLVGEDVLLLDFEHATPIGTTAQAHLQSRPPSPERDGVAVFAAPENEHGTAPSACADIYGLGATLRYLVDGGVPLQPASATVPCDPRLEQLIAACCAEQPNDRPSAQAVAERCRELSSLLLADPAEAVLADWTTGSFAITPLAGTTTDARQQQWHRRRRLLDRRPGMLERPHGLPTDPEGLQDELRTTIRVLTRFPRHPGALRRRAELLQAIGQLVAGAAETVHAYAKAEQFETADEWLAAIERLCRVVLRQPGGLTAITHQSTTTAPGTMQRAPVEFLQRLRAKVEGQRAELRQRVENIRAAERDLDLTRTEREIETMAAEYGGTSPAVASQRDQLHRLTFYLDRIARAQPNVERVGPLWDPIALQPLQQLIHGANRAVEARARRDGGGGGGAVGLRSLQLTLANLAEEFPHLAQVPATLEALTQALVHLTDQAWEQLAQADQRLRVVPVPVRPLQLALGRLDTFRMLEAFVDRPGRARSELLDGIERLRLGLEQARSARDRLAENAEHALARGHWTTGLFDMERAVAGLQPGDDHERFEADRLRERLQEARRTKQEIESAVRRNVELTAAYTALEDDPQSTFAARLQALEERRDCLLFLGMHVPSDRAVLYRQDLRGVETSLAVEQAAQAEKELDATTDPVARLRRTRATLERLATTTSSSDHGLEPPGRLVRLLDHWRTLAAQCQRAVDDLHRERVLQARQRRRMWAIAIIALIATTAAVSFAIESWLLSTPAQAR